MGAWIETDPVQQTHTRPLVAPLVGAWIETFRKYSSSAHQPSLPSWERGLKPHVGIVISSSISVAPLVGAWIETFLNIQDGVYVTVAPLVGAWIETGSTVTMELTNQVAPLVGAWIETHM